MANYSFITDIEKLNNGFSELATNISELGMFACCGNLNVTKEKYYKCATFGDTTPIAYEDSAIMSAFVGIITKAIQNGQEKDFQPYLRFSKELTGAKIMIYSNDQNLILPDNIAIKPQFENLSNEEFVTKIKEDIKQARAKIVIIANGADIINYNPQDVFAQMNKIAKENELMLFVGVNLSDTTQQANNYLANFAHNLCTLKEDFLKTSTEIDGEINHRLLRFGFGRPSSNVATFELDENGNAMQTYNLYSLLRFWDYARKFLDKPQKQTKLIENLNGLFKGEFLDKTIYSDIVKAVRNGLAKRIVSKANAKRRGINANTKISLPDCNIDKSFCNDLSALSTKAYPAEVEEFKKPKERRTIAKFGDFVVVNFNNENEDGLIASRFVLSLATMIVGGNCNAYNKFLDFKVETKHRDTLILYIGEKDNADKIRKRYFKPRSGRVLEIRSIEENTTDEDFLHFYRANVNSYPSNFVLIIGLNKLKFEKFSQNEILSQMAKTAKQQNFVGIVGLDKEIDSYVGFSAKIQIWNIFHVYENQDSIRRYYRLFPDIMCLETKIKGWMYRSYFKSYDHKRIWELKHEELKTAFLISKLYYYNEWTKYEEIKKDWIKDGIKDPSKYLRDGLELGLIKTYGGTGKITPNTVIKFIVRN